MELYYGQGNKLLGKGAKKLPVYVCHGQNEFLQKELSRKVLRFVLDDDELDAGYCYVDGSEDDALKQIADAVSERSLFAERQVVMVDCAEKLILKKDESKVGKKNVPTAERYTNYGLYEKILNAVNDPDGEVNLIVVFDGDLRRPAGKSGKSRSEKIIQRAYNDFNERGAIIGFKRMYEDEKLRWVRGRAKKAGVTWGGDMPEKFMEWAGDDLRHLANEIEKMAIFFGEGEPVTEREMRRLVSNNGDFFVYLMIDYMFDGRGKAALSALDRSFKFGSASVFIMNLVSSRLRQLWQMRYLMEQGYFRKMPREYRYGGKSAITNEIKRVSKKHRAALAGNPKDSVLKKTPFVLDRLIKNARDYKLRQIEEMIVSVADIDRKLKGIERPKRGSDEIMLQSLVVDVAAKKMSRVSATAVPKRR